jgi:hypothetical protein
MQANKTKTKKTRPLRTLTIKPYYYKIGYKRNDVTLVIKENRNQENENDKTNLCKELNLEEAG